MLALPIRDARKPPRITYRPRTTTIQPCPVCWQSTHVARTTRYGWIRFSLHITPPDTTFATLHTRQLHRCPDLSARARFRRKG